MWHTAKSRFRKYWRGSEILAKTLCVKSWFGTIFNHFVFRFLILSMFSIFFQRESLTKPEKLLCISHIVYPMSRFIAINDYRSKNGPKWQKVQLRHFSSNYLLYWGSNKKWFKQFSIVNDHTFEKNIAWTCVNRPFNINY